MWSVVECGVRMASFRGWNSGLWFVSSRVESFRHWQVVMVCEFNNLVPESNLFKKF